jgi:hypothetical protein
MGRLFFDDSLFVKVSSPERVAQLGYSGFLSLEY